MTDKAIKSGVVRLSKAERADLRRCRETGDVALGIKRGWLRRVGRNGFCVTDAGRAALRGES